ncbi:unnamed protein product [Caenorhabditis brenneri]
MSSGSNNNDGASTSNSGIANIRDAIKIAMWLHNFFTVNKTSGTDAELGNFLCHQHRRNNNAPGPSKKLETADYCADDEYEDSEEDWDEESEERSSEEECPELDARPVKPMNPELGGQLVFNGHSYDSLVEGRLIEHIDLVRALDGVDLSPPEFDGIVFIDAIRNHQDRNKLEYTFTAQDIVEQVDDVSWWVDNELKEYDNRELDEVEMVGRFVLVLMKNLACDFHEGLMIAELDHLARMKRRNENNYWEKQKKFLWEMIGLNN